MGTITTCDCGDCYNMDTNYCKTIYDIFDENLKKEIGFEESDYNICQDCVDTLNLYNPNMIIVDPDDEYCVMLNPSFKKEK